MEFCPHAVFIKDAKCSNNNQACAMFCAVTLMHAWRDSTNAQKDKLVQEIAKQLQMVSQADAQALPDKDPDVMTQLRCDWQSFKSFFWHWRV